MSRSVVYEALESAVTATNGTSIEIKDEGAL